jgi:hypothetical protein
MASKIPGVTHGLVDGRALALGLIACSLLRQLLRASAGAG